ncbi:MAG: toll/interleukin-1 receptor domain-containing protein, partial [Clostridia bacterium]|nr:toll/interleukin-1 receptor domain-containing protein [Clostridia bacterium]
MIFKCKICGGSLDVNIGERTAICEYCGVEQTIPSFIDIKAQEIYNIANNYLAHNEFDKAENLYAQILIDNKSDADAYWNILMCRYGVTYVKDPATEKYIPTCNRTLYAPIFNDENYKNAIKYADEKQRVLFEANARIIDDIQKGILSVSRKEKPFDIFISYKETDANGARTKDSITAQDLYEKLTAEGYKVFFSRITLEDKIGTEYEPYIYAALASSKVMITVSSSKENLESVWVKNEWSRFLSFMGKDSEKTLVPLYIDMDKSDMPDDFVHMPSYDMKTDGFEQDLIRGIKKLIPLPVMLLERRKKRNKILKRVGIAAAVCAVICVICAIPWFMKLPDYNAAMQLYYDKNYPEATWAFADLGQYRNSDKLKEKCELSWRKSLASIVAVPYELSYSDNIYYITDLGSVKQYNNNGKIDNSVNDLSINE